MDLNENSINGSPVPTNGRTARCEDARVWFAAFALLYNMYSAGLHGRQVAAARAGAAGGEFVFRPAILNGSQ